MPYRKAFNAANVRTLPKIIGAILFASILSPSLAQAQEKIDAVPLLRVYNEKAGWHLYTTKQTEVDGIVAEGWKLEGNAGWIFPQPVPGTTALYRRYRRSDGDHFYTTSKVEADGAIITDGYDDEGIVGFVAAQEVPGTRPFRRFYNSKFGHFYTADVNDAATAVQQAGYVAEGLAGYIWAGPNSVTTDNPNGNKVEGPKNDKTGDAQPGRGETESSQNKGAGGQWNWTAIAAAIAAILTAIAGLIAAIRRGDKS